MHDRKTKVGFIGAGNMSSALIGGLINSGYPAKQIYVADPNVASTSRLAENHGVNVADTNATLAAKVQFIILGVKPQFITPICKEISETINKAVIISVAAGIPVKSISDCFVTSQAVIRVMPNTPALISKGASGLFANEHVTEAQQEVVTQIFDSVGQSCWLEDEANMDLVTAISGSGPAYFFYLAECMIDSAVALGLSRKQAELLINQTALGASAMLKQSTKTASELRAAVTSPGGTTAAALSHLQTADFKDIVDGMVKAAVTRGKQLAKGE